MRPSARNRWRRPRRQARSTKRASASSPTSTITSWPTPRFGAIRRNRHEQDRRGECGRDERRREAVDGGRPLDVDRTLAPEAPQLAVGLERAASAPPCSLAFQCWTRPGRSGASRRPPTDLHRARGDRQAAHPSSSDPCGREQHEHEPDQVGGVGADAAALQPARLRGSSERGPERPADRCARRSGEGRVHCRRRSARRRLRSTTVISRSGRRSTSSTSRSGLVNPALVQLSSRPICCPQAQVGAGAARRRPAQEHADAGSALPARP